MAKDIPILPSAIPNMLRLLNKEYKEKKESMKNLKRSFLSPTNFACNRIYCWDNKPIIIKKKNKTRTQNWNNPLFSLQANVKCWYHSISAPFLAPTNLQFSNKISENLAIFISNFQSYLHFPITEAVKVNHVTMI